MAKTLIAIPQGSLMRVAETKGITTTTALSEKTSVDRKTLRAINAGRSVKETTLQSIADRLRVPLGHLIGASQADKHGVSIIGECHHREITLQRLDATALRRLAETGQMINWLLRTDQMPEDVELLLTELEKALERWLGHIFELAINPEEKNTLIEQISHVKASADIDKIAEELAKRKLNIYGGTFVYWKKEVLRDQNDDYHPIYPQTLHYKSRHEWVLCIAPEGKNISTVQIATGYEPPQEFDESKLKEEIIFVKVDDRLVWSRHDDDIPF